MKFYAVTFTAEPFEALPIVAELFDIKASGDLVFYDKVPVRAFASGHWVSVSEVSQDEYNCIRAGGRL